MKIKDILKSIEFLANVATIAGFVFLALFVLHSYVRSPQKSSAENEKLKRGTPLLLSGIDWTDAHSSLILALNVECRYCRASSEFYRRLVSLNTGKLFRPVAVFPQSRQEGQKYLEGERIGISDVVQADFQRVGVDATPTLILVDEGGRIISTWIGKLSTEEENDVIKHLQLEQGDKAVVRPVHVIVYNQKPDSSNLISGSELVRMRRSGKDIPLLDVRSRDEYAYAHIVGSLNIPMDELGARAPHELPKNKTLLVYCHYCPPCEKQKSEQGVETFCSFSLELLRRVGFSDAKLITDDLFTLKQVGVDISAPVVESRLQ